MLTISDDMRESLFQQVRANTRILNPFGAYIPFVLGLWLLAFVASGCGSGQAGPFPEVKIVETPSVVSGSEVSSTSTVESRPYVLFDQRWVEGLSSDAVDLFDIDAVFWHVFSSLQPEITVYPSENYFYFSFYMGGKQIWGNIRLPAGRRDRGVLSFGYFEFKESPFNTPERMTRSKFFTQADGVSIQKIDDFTYMVHYNGRSVKFNFHKLRQDPPQSFPLGPDEVYIERTFDESGYQFFLLFNTKTNYFFWVLNEEEPLMDNLITLEDDLLVGRKSGFAFWVDEAHDNRKVLLAIRGQSAIRNDYYDGPFDQLADNYVDVTNVSDYMVRAAPSLKDRIDKYGYYTNRDRPSRVSISPYYVYFSENALKLFLQRTKEAEEPYYFISRKGIPPTPTPVPAPTTGAR